MATNTKTVKTNPYAGKSRAELVKELTKVELEYRNLLSRGKLAGTATRVLRKDRARLLTAINAQ